MNSKYEQLKTAVQDLLLELRIDPSCLEAMARWYSPDYAGAYPVAIDPRIANWKNPHCKVQLSQVVAMKLVEAGIIEQKTEIDPAKWSKP